MVNNRKRIFGENLKQARKRRGYTQEKFAELIDISVSALSRIENGKFAPHEDTVSKILEVLGIKLYLLYLDNNDIDVESMYPDFIKRIELLKDDKSRFKQVYDLVVELTLDK